jgi:hypothetical protein
VTLDVRLTRNAGAVHENIDPAKSFADLIYHVLNVSFIGQINLKRDSPIFNACRLIQIKERYFSSVSVQSPGYRQTQSRRGARNDSHLPIELSSHR